MEQLDITKPPKVSYCIPTELRDQQILINTKNVKGRIEPYEGKRDEPIAVVCFGPSLEDTWEDIKNYNYIITCSGAHKFLIDKGLDPCSFKKWWHIDVDPREHKIKLLGTPHKCVEYLGASTCHPKYFKYLEGYDVKLWHVFANDEEAATILPRDEWWITGGSSVGARAMTIARFFGFTEQRVYGMDGCFKNGESHAAEHPNKPPVSQELEYNGKKFITTPSMAHCALEMENELNQLKDVNAIFYGEGLTQEIMKNYKRVKPRGDSLIAYNKEGVISEEYRKLNSQLHEDNPSYGMGGSKHKDYVLKMSQELKTTSILDYGCGKGMLQQSLDFPIYEYDPAIPGKDRPPRPADIVVCTDVLEHIEPKKLPIVLEDLQRVTKKLGYFVISTRKAVKTYANGQNTHLIVQGKEQWTKEIRKYFKVVNCVDGKDEVHFLVQPKVAGELDMDITLVKQGEKEAKFYTPNDTTKWRANSLFKKEPSTIEWIGSMKEGEILFDVGANIGSYTIWAGVNGVKVYAFEPEAENYSLLVKNMNLNHLVPNAYCIAVADVQKAALLYESNGEAGSACHTFGREVGHDLQPRKSPLTQGSLGIPLDTLVYDYKLPSPDHLKIDVDGLEFEVIKGAERILQNGLKSLLVEVNPALPEHQDMLKKLKELGYYYDPKQIEKAERKEGAFKGCAEYIFTKNPWVDASQATRGGMTFIPKDEYVEFEEIKNYNGGDALTDLLVKIQTTPLEKFPFPHLYIEDVFDKGYYEDLLATLPTDYQEIEKTRGTRGYPKRFTAEMKGALWGELKEELLGGELKRALCKKFGVTREGTVEDTLLIRDYEGYQISPHTDSLHKIITALFYLPEKEIEGAGTNLYIPKDSGFTCQTGKHYPFENFTKAKEGKFKPNSVLIFARTNNSFHGVEPNNVVRDVLLYNINKKKDG